MSTAGYIPMADRKGRFGAAYLNAFAAQAAVALTETRSGEDYLAVDASIDFPACPVRVQVKCGKKVVGSSGGISLSTRPTWRQKWAESKIPVYLLYVQVPPAPDDWMHCPEEHTLVRGRGYWLRVNQMDTPTVVLPTHNRLTLATFVEWRRDAEAAVGLGPAEEAP